MQPPQAPLAGRYQFKKSVPAGSKGVVWLAQDESGKVVVASALAGARVQALRAVVGVTQDHLASVLEILENPAPATIPGGKQLAAVVVAEHVAGESLHQRLKSGPLEPREAVETFQRLARAVLAIHEAGGAHGAISPRSIVMAPGDRLPPVLTQLVAPTSGAYCAPERLQGRGPSAPDDVWALHAALFSSLTCSPPFKGETKDQLLLSIAGGRQQKLESLGVREPELSEILEAGLTPDLARRCSGIEELLARLDAWLSAHSQGQWEDDEATLVASQRDYADALRSSEGEKPEPIPSMPPVAVEEDAGEGEAEPLPPPPPAPPPPAVAAPAPFAPEPPPPEPEAERNPFDDEDDATTVMGRPPIEDIRAALARQDPPEPPPQAFAPPAAAPAIPPPPPSGGLEPAPPPIPSAANLAPPPAAPESGALPAGVAAYPPLVSYPPPSMNQPAPPTVALDDDIQIRKAGRGPLIVIGVIVVLIAVAIGVAMYLNHRAAAAGRLTTDRGTTPSSSAMPPASGPAEPAPSAIALRSAAPSPAAVPVDRGQCVAHQFEAGTLQGNEGFDFLCDDADFRGVSSQLRRRLVVAGAGKVTPGMREWSTFGWFELAATAVIRARCCDATVAAIKLPKTTGDCPQLALVLPKVARQPVVENEVETRAETFSDAVLCLFTKGIPRPYSYSARPTGHARKIFEGFLRRASQHG